ncbi:MAG: tetratricopeptide repeat protein [Bacteroidales bacterium]|nr:tetratricopeptide repeat protein [Bacteroidales bacterium]
MHKVIRYLAVMLFLLSALLQEASAQYDKDVFYMRGRQALADGKYALAIENFNVLARLDTSDHFTFFFRGIAKYNLGDLRGAKRDFDRSVTLNPVFTSGWHYRGITESRFGNYEKALEDLQQAIDLRPGYIGLYFSRGVTYFLAQQFDKAIGDFDKYIRKEPKDPSAYLNRGASWLFLGDTLKAVQDYNKAIRLDRFDPEGYVRRGRLYAMQKKYDLALEDMDKAIELDTSNTFAYFNRAIMHYEQERYKEAMDDLNRVLEDEPGNALTLYNRGLISAQLGAYDDALEDMDRVLNINPENVLAYFNRASIFIEMGLYQNALEDYDRAIELYPDFAKAYMNRSYVKNLLGRHKEAKKDYDVAQRKVAEYRAKNVTDEGSFADTTKKYSSLLSLDAEFAKKDFNDELLQHRDIDIRLRSLYKFVLTGEKDNTVYALNRGYENPLISRFENELPVGVSVFNADRQLTDAQMKNVEAAAWEGDSSAEKLFLRALYDYDGKQFNSALNYYGQAIDKAEAEAAGFDALYTAFYHLNRGVLRAEMIDFISSIESNVQVLSMDDTGNTRARVKDQVVRQYDYTDAIDDMNRAAEIVPDLPYVYFNLGNLYCLSSEHVTSIENYTKAIELYPYMGDAYFNRGLVLIYLKDKEKGCIDLSRAGELGVQDAYGVIKKYCEEENE